MSFYNTFQTALAHLQDLTLKETQYLDTFNVTKVKEIAPEKEKAFFEVSHCVEQLKSDASVAKDINVFQKDEIKKFLDKIIEMNEQNAKALSIYMEAKESLITSVKKAISSKNYVSQGYTAFGRLKNQNQRVATPALSVSYTQNL